MRLDQLKPLTQALSIKDALGGETPIVFRVVGRDSPQFRAVVKKYSAKLLGEVKEPDVDALELQSAEIAASHIVGWEGLDAADGNALPYSHEQAIELMRDPQLGFLREQVEAFAEKRTNFFRASNEPTL